MSCDVTAHSTNLPLLILQTFRRFSYVTGSSLNVTWRAAHDKNTKRHILIFISTKFVKNKTIFKFLNPKTDLPNGLLEAGILGGGRVLYHICNFIFFFTFFNYYRLLKTCQKL